MRDIRDRTLHPGLVCIHHQAANLEREAVSLQLIERSDESEPDEELSSEQECPPEAESLLDRCSDEASESLA